MAASYILVISLYADDMRAALQSPEKYTALEHNPYRNNVKLNYSVSVIAI